MSTMHRLNRTLAALLVGGALVLSAGQALAGDLQKERTEIREQSDRALAHLYKVDPGARKAVESAAGYATFSNKGIKIGVAGGGTGRGLAVEAGTGKTTYMRFVEVQAGVGMGIKKYDLIFVFKTRKALDAFIHEGWQYGGQATAALKHGDEGTALAGAVSISPDVWLYQVTSSGLSADLTVKGSKYFPDKDLNDPQAK